MIRFPSFVYPFPDNSGRESTLNYLRVTLAPSASSLVLMSSASSLEAPSLTTLGAPSTTSLASFKPRPVTSVSYTHLTLPTTSRG